MSPHPTLSVVIPTFNRPESLRRTLASFLAQSAPGGSYEVIVVDNGSTMDSGGVADEFAGKIKGLRFVHEAKPGLHQARHRGLREAKAELLVYADDDIIAGPAWLESILKGFEDPRTGLVGGNDYPLFETPPPEWVETLWEECAHGRFLQYYSVLDFGDTPKTIDPNYVWGCNFAVRREVVLGAGGFHPDAFPANLLAFRGDGETHVSSWAGRNGWQAKFEPGASVQHLVPPGRLSKDYVRRRAFANGISYAYAKFREALAGDGTARGLLPSDAPWAVYRNALAPRREGGAFLEELRACQEQGSVYFLRQLASSPEVLWSAARRSYLDEEDDTPLAPDPGRAALRLTHELFSTARISAKRRGELWRTAQARHGKLMAEFSAQVPLIVEARLVRAVGGSAGRAAFFGAGLLCRWLLGVLAARGLPPPRAIFDDHAAEVELLGTPILRPSREALMAQQTIVLATDTWQAAFKESIRRAGAGSEVETIDLFEGLPKAAVDWFRKNKAAVAAEPGALRGAHGSLTGKRNAGPKETYDKH